MAIAATGALQFRASDINAVHAPADVKKPEYANLIAILNLVRRSNPDVQYAYIFRKTADPAKLVFVADADSLDPSEKKDLNHDGVIDDKDSLLTPGDPYNAFQSPSLLEGFDRPATDLGQDQWGSFISGYAPIKGNSGETIALLGVDVFASELDKLSADSFSPLYIFTILFVLFIALRFFAMNRSLMAECWQTAKIHRRKIALWCVFVLMFAGIFYYAFQQYKFHLLLDDTGKRLMAIAATAADDFDPADLDQLHFARDMKKEAYQRTFRKLNEIRNKNPEITYSYVLRPTNDPLIFEYIADADSNYFLPQYSAMDINNIPPFKQSNENIWPGYLYGVSSPPIFGLAVKRAAYGFIAVDKWGTAITGMAPIFRDGRLVAILCLDVIYDNKTSFDH